MKLVGRDGTVFKSRPAADMSDGSNDDATLAIGHLDQEARVVVDLLINQQCGTPILCVQANFSRPRPNPIKSITSRSIDSRPTLFLARSRATASLLFCFGKTSHWSLRCAVGLDERNIANSAVL